MTTPLEVRHTALHSRHQEAGALLTDFGGWEMPLWYPWGAVKEHLAVITAAGLFDTSHMDFLFISGKGAHRLLNQAFTRDLSHLRPGRALYGAFLEADGTTLDDAVLYPLDEDRFGVVVNAGMAPRVKDHLVSLPEASGVSVAEPEERLLKIDLQGPRSPALIRSILAQPDLLQVFPYFSFQGDFNFKKSRVKTRDGVPILLSRSGYTGEVGFEVFAPLAAAEKLWDQILTLGGKDVLPCGLAARDSLRAGALLPLSHQDIGHWLFLNHPWEFALPLLPEGGFSKSFVGMAGLDRSKAKYTVPFIGFDPRRVDRETGVALKEGREIGSVLTIVTDVAVGRLDGRVVSLAGPDHPADWKPRGLALGFLHLTERPEPGERLTLRDQRRQIEVEVAKDLRPQRTARKNLSVFLA